MDFPNIEMLPVESSQIFSIGHDPARNLLVIRFKDRVTGAPTSLYVYRNFTAADFQAFRDAESKGKHFGKYIKPEVTRYPYMRIEGAPAKAS